MELLEKLMIDPENTLWVLHAPRGVDALLPGIDIKTKLGKIKPVAQLMLFATDSVALNNDLPLLADYIGPNTLFWICYPKKTGAITSDLIMMAPWDVVFSSGYRGQTSVSINDDWTGMRFTNAPKKKSTVADVPKEERRVEGIDYIKRTAALPVDAVDVLATCKGLVDFFNALSFSHKRAYIEAIADAKKPETRVRRIEKMKEMLLKMMEEKELKMKLKR